MFGWDVSFGSEAESDLKKINTAVRERIINKIEWLQENFDNITPLALGGEWRGFLN